MSLGWFWSDDDVYENMSDYDVGVNVLTKLHDELVDHWGQSAFPYSLHDFLSYYAELAGNQIQGLGLGIKLAELPSSIIDDAIEQVVMKSNGRVPKTTQPLITALAGAAENGWISMYMSDALSASVDDFATLSKRLTEAGTQIAEGIGYGSKLIMPAAIIVGVAAILFFGKPYLKAASAALKKK